MLIFKIIFATLMFFFVTEEKISSYIKKDSQSSINFGRVINIFFKILAVYIVVEEVLSNS